MWGKYVHVHIPTKAASMALSRSCSCCWLTIAGDSLRMTFTGRMVGVRFSFRDRFLLPTGVFSEVGGVFSVAAEVSGVAGVSDAPMGVADTATGGGT